MPRSLFLLFQKKISRQIQVSVWKQPKSKYTRQKRFQESISSGYKMELKIDTNPELA